MTDTLADKKAEALDLLDEAQRYIADALDRFRDGYNDSAAIMANVGNGMASIALAKMTSVMISMAEEAE